MPLPPAALIWCSCLGVMFFEDPIAAFAKCAPGDEAGGTGGARGVPRASGKPVAKRIARSGAPPAATDDTAHAGHLLLGRASAAFWRVRHLRISPRLAVTRRWRCVRAPELRIAPKCRRPEHSRSARPARPVQELWCQRHSRCRARARPIELLRVPAPPLPSQ